MQPHLDDEWIARALAGDLPVKEATQAIEHAEGCPTCRAQLVRLETGSVSVEGAAAPARRAQPLPLPVAARVGRYVILERLGEGGMGAVYSAFDPELGRRIAVKVLHAAGDGGHPALAHARLLREAQAMARLQHPNVIAVYDVGTLDERVFFAMEQVDGGTLRGWLAERRSWREVLSVFVQAGRGLAAAHAAGIVHRDFKPENVLMDKDGRVRVTDFGVARAMGAGAEPAPLVSGAREPELFNVPLTRFGQVVGTPGYMAPEQLDGQVTAETDQFSFCVALYEALVGERPFVRWPHDRYFRELREKRVEFPAGARVPGFVRDVVLRGLHKNPASRFSSMDALLDALARDPRARRTRIIAAAGVLAAVALVGGRALVLRAQHQRSCAELAGRATGQWEQHRAAISTAFRAVDKPVDKPVMARIQRAVEAGFAAFAADWGEHRRAVCLDQAALPRELLPTSAACLDHAAEAMRHAAELLATGGATVVQHAGQILAALPSPRTCVDAATLRSRPPPPRDPDKAALVPAARARLARAEIEVIARPHAGLEGLKALVREIEALDSAPALAEAHFVLGEAQVKADLTDDAAKSLQRAAELALAGGDDRLFVRAASRLAYVAGGFHGEAARAADWMALARQAFERTGGPPALDAWLHLQEVALHIGAGRWPECVRAAERAVAGFAREGDHLHEAEATYILSFCTEYARGPRAAKPIVERAFELYTTWAGPAHPEMAEVFNSMADHRDGEGDLAGAITFGAQSLDITRAIGRPTLQLSLALARHARRVARAGRPAEALALVREAHTVLQQVPHPPKSDVRVLADLAAAERSAGLHAAAVAHAEQANAACSAEVQQGFPDICAHAQFIDAKLLLDRGRRAEAARQAARARDGFATLTFEPQLRDEVEAWARQVGIVLPAGKTALRAEPRR